MSPSCEISVKRQDNGETALVSGVFSDEEWGRLNAYLQHVDVVAEAPVIKAGFKVHMQLSFNAATGSRVTSTIPPMDDIRLLLHKLRPLILESEPTSFMKIRALLCQRLDNVFIRGTLQDQLETFDGRSSQSVVRIKLNENLLNSENFLLKWLNAHEYHRDEDKQKEIAALDAAFPEHASRAVWISLLVDKCNAIFNMAHVVACVLGKQKQVAVETAQVKST